MSGPLANEFQRQFSDTSWCPAIRFRADTNYPESTQSPQVKGKVLLCTSQVRCPQEGTRGEARRVLSAGTSVLRESGYITLQVGRDVPQPDSFAVKFLIQVSCVDMID